MTTMNHITASTNLSKDNAQEVQEHLEIKTITFLLGEPMYFFLRFLKWDPWFNPKEETTIAIAWISFPGSPTNLFDKNSMLSIANVIGKLLVID